MKTFEEKLAAVTEELTKTPRISGKKLREKLKQHHIKLSAPNFYLLMSKFEESGYLEAYYKESNISGYKVKTKCFRLKNNHNISL